MYAEMPNQSHLKLTVVTQNPATQLCNKNYKCPMLAGKKAELGVIQNLYFQHGQEANEGT